jgi:hypothetical protein
MKTLYRQLPMWGILLWSIAILYTAGPQIPNLWPVVVQYWWIRIVPLVFPSLLTAEIMIQLLPASTGLQALMRSLASFPLVGAMRRCDHAANESSSANIYDDLVWSNCYNPLLFAPLSRGILLDISLLIAAWITIVSHGRSHFPFLRQSKASIRWRSAALDTMNWVTILLAELIVSRIARLPSWHWLYQIFVDPFPPSSPQPLLNVFMLATNGIIMLLPLLLYAARLNLSWQRIAMDRLIQAGWATLVYWILISFLPQFHPIVFYVVHDLR